MHLYDFLHSLILHFTFIFILIFILMIFGFKHLSSIFFKIHINLRTFINTKNVSFFPYFFIFLHRIPRCLPSFYLTFYILFRFFVKGKTTSAASWGVLLSDSGLKTLVISTDPAHSLGDAFQEKLNGVPRKLDTGSSGGNFIFFVYFCRTISSLFCVPLL